MKPKKLRREDLTDEIKLKVDYWQLSALQAFIDRLLNAGYAPLGEDTSALQQRMLTNLLLLYELKQRISSKITGSLREGTFTFKLPSHTAIVLLYIYRCEGAAPRSSPESYEPPVCEVMNQINKILINRMPRILYQKLFT